MPKQLHWINSVKIGLISLIIIIKVKEPINLEFKFIGCIKYSQAFIKYLNSKHCIIKY